MLLGFEGISHCALSSTPRPLDVCGCEEEKNELCSGLECQPHVSAQDVCCFPDRIWVRPVRRCSYLGISLICDL